MLSGEALFWVIFSGMVVAIPLGGCLYSLMQAVRPQVAGGVGVPPQVDDPDPNPTAV